MTRPDALTQQPTPSEQLTNARRQMFENALKTGALVETHPDEGPSLISITLSRTLTNDAFRADQGLIDPETGKLIGDPELHIPDTTVQSDLLAWVRERTGWAPDVHPAWQANSEGFSYVRIASLETGMAEIVATHSDDRESILIVPLPL